MQMSISQIVKYMLPWLGKLNFNFLKRELIELTWPNRRKGWQDRGIDQEGCKDDFNKEE